MARDPYDIREIFDNMTLGLISSLKRNLSRHQDEELGEGFRWEQWQSAKLRALASYQKTNRSLIRAAIKDAEELTGVVVKQSYDVGIKAQESWWSRLWNRILKPFGLQRKEVDGRLIVPENIKPLMPEPVQKYMDMAPPAREEDFFGLNEKKLDALREGIQKDLRNTAGPIYRKMDDVYRQVIYRTSHYVTAGAKTIDQAVDMATKEFLSKGIDCIVYSDGRRVNISSYAEMALRTVSQRATFLAEGRKRDEWGVYTVVMSAHDNCSPWCIPYQGTVMIDDVYTSISREQAAALSKDIGYPLLSQAMAEGAFHPNCRHTLATFFPGISRVPTLPDEEKAERNYDAEQKQRYLERNIRMYKRLEAGSLDKSNQDRHGAKVDEWQDRLRQLLADNDDLRRDRRREQLNDYPTPTKKGTIKSNVPSGAIKDPKRQEKHAETFYGHVRKRKDDVLKIATNTGWKESAIREIKDHVFIKEHLLQGKMQRFYPDYDQAQAWQRLIEGKHTETDLVFLRHEYVELTQMRIHGYNYEQAHAIANKMHNWQKLIEEE
jgi:hypothetical protein